MLFQYIRAESAEENKKYLIPPYVTRFCYRKKFTSESGVADFSLQYPFKLDLFLDGKPVCAMRQGDVHTFSCSLKRGSHLLAIRAYLSDRSEKFYPELYGEVRQNGEIIARTDETWEGFTFPEFYTTAEEEGWMMHSEKRFWARCCSGRPSDINHSQIFRKEILLRDVPEKVILQATAKGLYQAYCNGEKIDGDAVLLPGVVKARPDGFPYASARCNYYRESDITKYFRAGKNVFWAVSGNGWYASEGFNVLRIAPNEVAFRLTIHTKEGELFTLETDDTWQCRPSPIEENDLQFGERWNGPLDVEDIEQGGGEWNRCVISGKSRARLQTFPPVRIVFGRIIMC